MLTLASALREMFGVQLYKNNARALLSRILSILNLDWLQHARIVRGVYESYIVTTNGGHHQKTKDIARCFYGRAHEFVKQLNSRNENY